MNFGKVMVGLVLATATVPAVGQQTSDPAPTPAAPADPKAKDAADRIICRTDDEIGSRIHKRKICMTSAQWRDLSTQSGMAAERKEALVSKPGGG
jgi:hypothetical protein